MKTDTPEVSLIERLRSRADEFYDSKWKPDSTAKLLREAAEKLEVAQDMLNRAKERGELTESGRASVMSETGATRFNEEQQAMVEDVMLAKTVQHETSPYDTMAALTYLYESTASQGQWANHAVHSFVGAMLRSVAAPEPSELQVQAGAVILATTAHANGSLKPKEAFKAGMKLGKQSHGDQVK